MDLQVNTLKHKLLPLRWLLTTTRVNNQPSRSRFVYVFLQIGISLLFFVATWMLYFSFKESLAELLLVLTDSKDEELAILSSYTRESLYLFLVLFCIYLLCCVLITMNACKRKS